MDLEACAVVLLDQLEAGIPGISPSIFTELESFPYHILVTDISNRPSHISTTPKSLSFSVMRFGMVGSEKTFGIRLLSSIKKDDSRSQLVPIL